jgi:DNA-binding NarL/FixJ family response regulator
MMDTPVRILIADDHPIFRGGLKAVLQTAPHLTVVGEAENGELALARIRETSPDVVLLDLDMPVKDGFAVIDAVHAEQLPVSLIVLTAHKSDSVLNRVMDLGIKGIVLKDSAVIEILDCIAAVSAGGSYASPQLATILLNRSNRRATLARTKPGLLSLSPTERRVLTLIAQDKNTREIAEALFISARTVEHHRANICLKLDVHGSNALMKFALANKSDLQ